MIEALGKQALLYISYLFSCSSEKFDTKILKITSEENHHRLTQHQCVSRNFLISPQQILIYQNLSWYRFDFMQDLCEPIEATHIKCALFKEFSSLPKKGQTTMRYLFKMSSEFISELRDKLDFPGSFTLALPTKCKHV